MNQERISLEEIRETLTRSGYLLESRLVRSLTELGYFVEPNQVVRDPRTGKSREIDLVVEHYSYDPERDKVCVKTYFVVEAINNRYPFVLITERHWTPNTDIESYIKWICTPEPNPFLNELDVYEEKQVGCENLFSQYCVLSKKKNDAKELMASHPDDVHGSLLKLAKFVEDEVDWWNSRDLEHDEYCRLFFWQPMLVLSGELLAARIGEDGALEIRETSMGRLEFNWHADDQRRTTVIEVVTEQFFLQRVAAVVQQDEELSGKMHSLREQMLLDGQGRRE